jgi:hypothetical protein
MCLNHHYPSSKNQEARKGIQSEYLLLPCSQHQEAPHVFIKDSQFHLKLSSTSVRKNCLYQSHQAAH